MKKLFLVLLMILCIGTSAWAATVTWNASVGASGYEIYWRALGAPTWTTVDVGNVLTWTTPATWVVNTRYEIRARAYVGPTLSRSYSGDSDILRWTLDPVPQIVELAPSVKQIIINVPTLPVGP